MSMFTVRTSGEVVPLQWESGAEMCSNDAKACCRPGQFVAHHHPSQTLGLERNSCRLSTCRGRQRP